MTPLCGRRIGELPFPTIDAYMGNAVAAGVEEHKVSGLQIALTIFCPGLTGIQECGKEILNCLKTYDVNPEQSKPFVVVPAIL